MIRSCNEADFTTIGTIINQAAEAYRGMIPADCWHEPYMSASELRAEIAAGVGFQGWEESGALVGVMGVQKVREVTLVRHAYVRPSHQGQGFGGALISALIAQASGPLLVGTWAAADWAIRFYERYGFHLVSAAEKDHLLVTYWRIPQRQKETSVVLMHAR